MSMKMMNAAYLVDNVALLSLQEKQDGLVFYAGRKREDGSTPEDSDAEISRRESVLGKLSDLSSRTDTPVKTAKAKEAER